MGPSRTDLLTQKASDMKMTAFSLLKLRFSNVCISTHDLMEIQKTLTIARGYARSILDGKKHYEARLWNDRLGELNVGAKLCFHWYGKERLLCSISEVLTFETSTRTFFSQAWIWQTVQKMLVILGLNFGTRL